ncbi:IS3 family transposase, partial [Methylobacterium sp. D54C]
GLLPVCHRNPPPSGKELSTFAEQVQTRAIVALASEYGRHGYRRVTALLQADGWQVGKDRVQRIWRREGLEVPSRHKPCSRLWLNDGSCGRLRPL